MKNFGAIDFSAWEARALMSWQADREMERAQADALANTAYFASLAAGVLANVAEGEAQADAARDAAFRMQAILAVAEIGDRLSFKPFRQCLPKASTGLLWRNVANSLSEICETLRLPLGCAWNWYRTKEHGFFYNPDRRRSDLEELFSFADRNLVSLMQRGC